MIRAANQLLKTSCFLLYLLPALLLSGCAMRLFGFLTAEEMGLARLAGVRIGATGVAIENEAALSSMIARTRLFRPLIGNPRLYIMENGIRKEFAELTSPSTLRWLRSGNSVTLPGRLYTVRNNFVNVNLRYGPGHSYAVYKTIPSNRLLILLEENNGWCKVKLDNSVIGWVAAATIVESVAGTPPPVQKNTQPDSTSRMSLDEVRFIDLGNQAFIIREIKQLLTDSADIAAYTEETNAVPTKAAGRLSTGITIRYFDNNDAKKATRIKKLCLNNSSINKQPVNIENIWTRSGNSSIPRHIEIWVK